MPDLINELKWRGLFHQATDENALREHLAEPRRVYAGFDPTADSLTVGNLVPIMLLKHFQRAGHTPVVVMGGGTGLIGDPSGKEAERQLRTHEEIESNIAGQRPIFEGILEFEGKNAATIVNNHDWLGKLSYIEALRDIGKHFSVNMMIQKESVKNRLEGREQGISYTEFSYMILQAYDFLRLYEDQNVTVQVGGSDQWGNIVAGSDLIRRIVLEPEARKHDDIAIQFDLLATSQAGSNPAKSMEYRQDAKRERETAEQIRNQSISYGLTAPLVTKSDGGKFGKTEGGAIWLTAERTSPYAFYQFWLNASDEDAARYMKLFTLLPQDEIESIIEAHTQNPGARKAQRRLAQEITTLVHGDEGVQRAEAATHALFSGDVASLDEASLNEVFADVASTVHSKSELAGEGVALVELLPLTSLAKSKREAREFLSNGSVSINGAKVSLDDRLTAAQLLHGSVALLKRGKKTWHVTRWM